MTVVATVAVPSLSCRQCVCDSAQLYVLQQYFARPSINSPFDHGCVADTGLPSGAQISSQKNQKTFSMGRSLALSPKGA